MLSVKRKKSGKGPKQHHVWLEIDQALKSTKESIADNNLVRLIGQYEYIEGVHKLTNSCEHEPGAKIAAISMDLSLLEKYPPTGCGVEVFGALYVEPEPFVRAFFYSDLGYDAGLREDYIECMRTQMLNVRV